MSSFMRPLALAVFILASTTTLSALAQDRPSILDRPAQTKEQIVERLRALAGPPANDSFAAAQMLTGNDLISGTTTDATDDTVKIEDEELALRSGVWFKWTSPASPTVLLVDTIGSEFDTMLHVFTGASQEALTLFALSDDFAGSLQSLVGFLAEPSTDYYITVSGYEGSKGAFLLTTATRHVVLGP